MHAAQAKDLNKLPDSRKLRHNVVTQSIYLTTAPHLGSQPLHLRCLLVIQQHLLLPLLVSCLNGSTLLLLLLPLLIFCLNCFTLLLLLCLTFRSQHPSLTAPLNTPCKLRHRKRQQLCHAHTHSLLLHRRTGQQPQQLQCPLVSQVLLRGQNDSLLVAAERLHPGMQLLLLLPRLLLLLRLMLLLLW